LVKVALQIDIAKLNSAIVSRLEALQSPSVDNIRNIRGEFSAQMRPLAARQVIQLALLLLESNELIPRFFAYELVHYHAVALKSLNSRNIMMLGQGINSWAAAVDTFAC
jgi:hypothetical protein